MIEIWKDIEGYEGYYMVSNHGNVQSLNYRRTNKIKLLKKHKLNNGRKNKEHFIETVMLYKNGVHEIFKVHRLVAKAFLTNTEGKSDVNHINCNSLDNRVENLEWSTRKENMQHAFINKLNVPPSTGVYGKDHPKAKEVVQFKENEIIHEYGSITDASNATGISFRKISHACRGNQKQAGGFIWKFKN